MARLLLALALLAVSCDAFVVSPTNAVVGRATNAAAVTAVPSMLFGGSTRAAPKKAAKKPLKKKVVKKVAKKVAKKPGFKGPSAAQPGSNPLDLAGQFFSEENWAYQAVTLLRGLPSKGKKYAAHVVR